MKNHSKRFTFTYGLPLVVALMVAGVGVFSAGPSAEGDDGAAGAPKETATSRPSSRPAPRPASGLLPVPDDIELIAEVTYKQPANRRTRMDIYRLKNRPAAPAPVLVAVHGGGWIAGSKNFLRPHPKTMAFLTAIVRAGVVVATINYGSDGRGSTVDTMVGDCKDAVRFLRRSADKYGLDGKRIGTFGGSAGGHLAVMVAVTGEDVFKGDKLLAEVSSRVSFAIAHAGSMDLTITRGALAGPAANPRDARAVARQKAFGGSLKEAPENYRRLSPITHLAAACPPLMIVHGTRDPIVPVENGDRMAAKARKLRVKVEYLRVEGGGHTLFYDAPAAQKPPPDEVAAATIRFVRKQFGVK